MPAETKLDATHIYLPDDDQGPWVLLCRACIDADGHEVAEDAEWLLPEYGWHCACCGTTGDEHGA